MRLTRRTALIAMAAPWLRGQSSQPYLEFAGGGGLGQGRHIVLVSGDEEYRSEEALPQLAKILAGHHGFRCTVLFAIDPKDGTINPDIGDNIPHLDALRSADLMIIATRFRHLPEEQMREIDTYVQSGRPIMGLRTATHAFNFPADSANPFRRYSWNDKTTWPGGFGKQVLGETWISHHGHHAVQSTRAIAAPGAKRNPILRGCSDIWGPTDVYTAAPPADAEVLLLGQVLTGMSPTDGPVVGEYVTGQGERRTVKRPNDPMMPVAWTRSFTGRDGKVSRVFTTTMGAATDMLSEGFRRLLVNATLWALGSEARIPEQAFVGLVGDFQPTQFGFKKYVKGRRPADYA